MRYKIGMTLKSPLFIGQAFQKLTPMDYIQYEKSVYPISERLFLQLLQEKKLMNNFVIHVDPLDKTESKSLKKYLVEQELLNEEIIKRISKNAIQVDTNLTFNEYHPIVKDIYGNPYIPGSAIKGAIRTGIFYDILRKLKEENPECYESYVVEKLNAQFGENPKGKTNFKILNDIEKNIFQSIFFPNDFGKNDPPNKDILRIVKVSDSKPLPMDSTRIVEVKVLNFNRDSKLYNKISVFVECLPKDTKIEFDIVFDDYIYKQFTRYAKNSTHLYNLKDIFLSWTKLSEEIMNDDLKYFNHAVSGNTNEKQRDNSINVIPTLDFYENGFDANFRLGWGCGMNSMTILMLLEPDLRSKWGEKLSRKNFELFPKTRKVVWNNDDPGSPLGWAKLKVLE